MSTVALPACAATGIGSVPFTDPAAAVGLILQYAPELPFWPQLVKLGFREDMVAQGSGGFAPLLVRDDDRKVVRVNDALDREEALTRFYEVALAGDLAPFALAPEEARGFFALLDAGGGSAFCKGHLCGPVTFAATVKTADGKALLADSELLQAVNRGIGLKAAWQAAQFRQRGKTALIFFDEPSLTGFGSAFMPISRQDVVAALTETMQAAREHGDLLTGIHCCGNTDWALLLDTPIDVLSFDAYGFFDTLILYEEAVRGFLDRGGYLAFGLVPTTPDSPAATADTLWTLFLDQLARLAARGLPRSVVLPRVLFTAACGLGYLAPAQAQAALAVVADLSARGRRLLSEL